MTTASDHAQWGAHNHRVMCVPWQIKPHRESPRWIVETEDGRYPVAVCATRNLAAYLAGLHNGGLDH